MDIKEQLDVTADKIESQNREVDSIDTTKVAPIEKPISKNNVGLDVGTMNLVRAIYNGDSTDIKSFRNVFLEVDTESLGNLDLSLISHTVLEDKTFFLSEDAYNFANIFSSEVKRPMKDGVISNKEIDSVDLLTVIIKDLIGLGTPGQVCCYSVPANPIDSNVINITYHENVFKRILDHLGYIPRPINESLAIIYSECSGNNFTGIAISFGAGLTNIAVVFKAIPVIEFSINRAGDWIDTNTSNSIGVVPNKVTSVKEKADFNLSNFNLGKKREKRIREALMYYYKDLLNYTTRLIVSKLDELDIDFPAEVPIIVSGGTSKAEGFVDSLVPVLADYDFPFDVSEVRVANDPLTAVAEGCLIASLSM
jgi:hypothetical protein